MTGRKKSAKTRKKLSVALTGLPRTKVHGLRISNALRGKYLREKSFNWRGGTYKSQGRWYVRFPEHPRAHHNGYLLRSRFVAESLLGRPLKQSEVIHHIDQDKSNDNPANLYLFQNRKDHDSYHSLLRHSKVERITTSNLSS